MSAFDQALIKAYSQDAASPTRPALSLWNPDTAPDEPAAEFRPQLQVDAFAWPEVCLQLDAAAADQLDRLADGVADAMKLGQAVVGFGGCSQSEGATTLLLCAARRLAERGLRVILVDADRVEPALAARLAVLPECGWQEVLAGRMPLEEAVVESAADRLDLLPSGGPTDKVEASDDEPQAPAAALDTLAAHYDLVLVDLGTLEDPALDGESPVDRLDAVALVHNPNATSPAQLAEVQRRIDALGLAQAVIQNFVRGQ